MVKDGYKQTIDGVIPNNWELSTIDLLSKSFTKQTGFDYSTYIKPSLVNRYKKGVIPFIQNKDFDGKITNFDTDYYVPENIANNFPRILLNEECFLISISGSIGKVGVFSNLQKAFIGGAVGVAKFKDKSSLDWVMYYLQSNNGQKKLFINVKAGSHQNLILDDIRKILIPMPPKEEQKAIATALSDTDKLINSLEKLISKKEDIKIATMQQLLTGKKRLDGFSGEWEEKKFQEVIKLQGGYAFQSSKFKKQGIKIIRISNIQDSNIDLDDVVFYDEIKIAKDFYVIKNDILIAMSGATTGKVGRYLGQNFSYLNQRVGKLVTLNEIQNDKNFIYYLSISIEFTNQLVKMLAQGAQPNISGKQIESMRFSFPTKDEQTAIATILSDMDKELEKLKSKLSKTKAIKEGMMQELLTGKTRLIS